MEGQQQWKVTMQVWKTEAQAPLLRRLELQKDKIANMEEDMRLRLQQLERIKEKNLLKLKQ